MKKVLKIVAFASSLVAVTACGNNEGQEHSEVAGNKPVKEAKDAKAEHLDFNLGSYLAQSVKQPPQYLELSKNGIGVGQRKYFQLINNITIKSEPQKVAAQYYADLYALDDKLVDGHMFDVVARAETIRPEAMYDIRIAGQSLKSGKITSKYSFDLYRGSYGMDGTIPIVAGLNIDLAGKIGGDIKFDISPKFELKTKTAEVEITPKASLIGAASAGVSALIASASVNGKVELFKGSLPLSGGFTMLNGVPQPVLFMQPLELSTLGGGIDLEASLSLGNVLPGPAKTLWKAVFGKGLTYTHNLVKWDGIDALVTDGYILTPGFDL